MDVHEPEASTPARIPAPPDVVARAMALVKKYPGCFWFRHPEARIRFVDDIEVVVQNLREYGDKKAWEDAKELRRCL